MPECFTDNGGNKHDGSNIAPETTPEIIRPNFSCNRNFRRNSHRKWTGNWHLWDHRSNVLSTKNTFLCHNISTTSFDKIADYCFTSIWKTLRVRILSITCMNICDFKHFEKMRYLQNERLKYFFLNCNIPYCWRYFSSFYLETKTVSIRPFNPYWQILFPKFQFFSRIFFRNFSFPSHEAYCMHTVCCIHYFIITGKLIQFIFAMSILGLWATPYYLKTHPIENYEQIFDGWVFQH